MERWLLVLVVGCGIGLTVCAVGFIAMIVEAVKKQHAEVKAQWEGYDDDDDEAIEEEEDDDEESSWPPVPFETPEYYVEDELYEEYEEPEDVPPEEDTYEDEYFAEEEYADGDEYSDKGEASIEEDVEETEEDEEKGIFLITDEEDDENKESGNWLDFFADGIERRDFDEY